MWTFNRKGGSVHACPDLRVEQDKGADLLSSMVPSMLVQPSMAIRSSTERAVAEDTQQPCAKPAAIPAAAASVLFASNTALSAAA